MSIKPIKAIKYLLKKALKYDIPDLKNENYYLILLNKLKYLKVQNRAKIYLLIMIFEKMFILNGKMRVFSNENKIKEFISFCDMNSIPENVQKDPNLYAIMKSFKFMEVDGVEFSLIYQLMNNNKSSLIYFKIVEELICSTNDFYIRNKEINIKNIDYVAFILKVINFFKTEFKKYEKDKYFTFDFTDNELIIKYYSSKDLEKFTKSDYNFKKIYPSTLIKYIKEISKKEENNIEDTNTPKKIDNNIIKNSDDSHKIIKLEKDFKELQEWASDKLKEKDEKINKLNMIVNEQNEKIAKLKLTLNDQNNKIKELEKKIISQFEDSKRIDSLNAKKINDLKNKFMVNNSELKKKKEELVKENNSLKNKLKNYDEKIAKINEKITSINQVSDKKSKMLNEELNKKENDYVFYKNEYELIKSRDTNKFIIDFLYVIIFKKDGFFLNYDEKINFICEKINKVSNNRKDKFCEDLVQFLYKILDNKKMGDNLVHPQYLWSIPPKYKNIDNFLKNELDISNYFTYFKKLYKAKNKNEDVKSKISEILTLTKDIKFNL